MCARIVAHAIDLHSFPSSFYSSLLLSFRSFVYEVRYKGGEKFTWHLDALPPSPSLDKEVSMCVCACVYIYAHVHHHLEVIGSQLLFLFFVFFLTFVLFFTSSFEFHLISFLSLFYLSLFFYIALATYYNRAVSESRLCSCI